MDDINKNIDNGFKDLSCNINKGIYDITYNVHTNIHNIKKITKQIFDPFM